MTVVFPKVRWLLLFSLLFLAGSSVQANQFTVNTTQDTTHGGCSTLPNGCSLRDAVKDANSNGGVDTISFAIPNTDSGFDGTTYNITLTSDLPTISDALTLDGTTQIGDSNPSGPEIQLISKNSYGFRVSSINSTIKGFIINGPTVPISLESYNNVVRGCYIGTDPTGVNRSPYTSGFPAYRTGIAITGSNNIIGGIESGQGNRIAFAGSQGVAVEAGFTGTSTGNSIRGNAIFNNSNWGIDLVGSFGTTPNDVGDTDTGPNNLQNFPVITLVKNVGSNTVINYSLNSLPSKTYNIDFYNAGTGTSIYGQGNVYIGTRTLTTNASGDGQGSITIAGITPLNIGYSATATDTDGNTSEFARFVLPGVESRDVVTNTHDSGLGSLRAALEYAKSVPNTTIKFNIPNVDGNYNSTTGVYSIYLINPLDVISTDGTIIDGSSQTRFGGNTNPSGPEIQLLGLIGNVNPITGGFSSVINGFKFENGIQIEASNCAVNGLILNNFKRAIYLTDGILPGKNNTIRGCYIGTDHTGNAAMPNFNNDYKYGISILNSSNNIIGGIEAGQGNRIAYSDYMGVNVAYGTGNSIRGNSIFGNGGLGINLDGPYISGGINPNDDRDVDTGTNELQNFPIITHVEKGDSRTYVFVSLNSVPSKTYAIDVYRMPPSEVDYTGYGEGKTYAGTVNLTTNSAGNGSARLEITGIFENESYTATATDPNGNTSEFSFAFNPGGDSPAIVRNTNDSGTGSLRAAINYANGNAVSRITFLIPKTDPGYNAATGVFTIRVTSSLPPISGAGTVIDGSSQTANGDTNPKGPEIEITSNGYEMGYGLRHGLQFTNANCTIKNVILNGFRIPIGLRGYSNKVFGCYIGTDATGTIDSPNNRPNGSTASIMEIGIELFPSDTVTTNHQIGGLGDGEGNRIAFAKGSGVAVQNYIYSNTIRGNSIFKNGGVGIDLSGNGLTVNDDGDRDFDANQLQNFPTISSVTTVGDNTQVSLSLNSIANQAFIIDLYRTPLSEASNSGFGDGKSYVKTVNITTDANGNGATTATIAGSIGSDVVTATATDAVGNTSEFSAYVANNGSTPLTVTTTADDGIGSFRKALEYANGNLGGTIKFNIPTSDSGFNPTTGVWTIAPLKYLPQFARPIVVDGSSQPGNTNTRGPEIELTGAATTLYYGPITAPGSVIRGLMVNGYSTPLVLFGGTTVESCYIGTDYTGTAPSPNNNVSNTYENGIEVRGEGNIIGGDSDAKRNAIGFTTDTTNSTKGNGIFLYNSARNNLIRKNTIVRNAKAGIGFSSQNGLNVIRDNLIRDNAGAGISLPSTYEGNQNTIRFNSIVENGGLGIDLGADGVTANDVGDAEVRSLANHGLNQPVLTGMSASGSDVIVTGTYNSRPNSTFEIDFYGNLLADASGYGEGNYFLSTLSVKTDANGNVSFSKTLPTSSGGVISATATAINIPTDESYNGDTSEFSNSIKLTNRFRLGSATYTVSESASSIAIKVSRLDTIAGVVSVKYATSDGNGDPAIAGSDYTSTNGTLTWANGDSADKIITIPIIDDTLDEVNENFIITLSEPGGGAVLGTPSTATVTIVDNDTDSTLKLRANSYSVNEDASSVKIAVARESSTTNAVSVQYLTFRSNPSSAIAGADYGATIGTLNWANGDAADKIITVPIFDDAIYEGNETFNIALVSPSAGAMLGTPASAVVTIVDNDNTNVLSLSSATYSVNENASAAVVTVNRTQSTVGAVSVKYTTSNGAINPAAEGSDYAKTSGTLNWADGDASSKTITIPINNDTLDEVNENFSITLSAPGGGAVLGMPSSAVITIVDNDTDSVIKLKAGAFAVDEGALAVNIAVTRQDSSTNAVSVKYATSNGTNILALASSDYTATSGTLTWADGDKADKIITIPIVNDLIDEGNENFNITLSTPSAGATLGLPASAVVLIVDNDQSGLSIGDAQAVEGDTGVSTLTFPVTLSYANVRPVTVNFATTIGSTSPASIGTDYLSNSGTLTFNPGEKTKSVSVAIVGDKKAEPLETFRVVLSNQTNTALTRNTGIGTILDNDSKASLSISDVQVQEGDTGTTNAIFTVKLATAIGRAVTVKYAAAKGTATLNTDFLATTGTLNFAIGETVKTISVPVKGDTIDEADEQFSVKLSSPLNATLTDATGVATIKDDDASPTFIVTGSSVREGNKGKTLLNFVISLNRASSQTVKITYLTAPATTAIATAKTDYTEIKPKSLTFKPGETSKTVAVSVVGDTLPESDERVGLRITTPVNATISANFAEGIILNDDGIGASGNEGDFSDGEPIQEALPTLSIDDTKIVEGNSGTSSAIFTVHLSKASERQVSLSFATANVTAVTGSDYESKSGNLSFAPGETSRTISVIIKGDKVTEGDEQFKVVLSRSINATIDRISGTGIIANDDLTSGSISQS